MKRNYITNKITKIIKIAKLVINKYYNKDHEITLKLIYVYLLILKSDN